MDSKLTFVSAGAGSGKTWHLTEILRKQLTANGVRPEGVIATTFTNRAATELRERVRGHLLTKGELALAVAMGQARIGTVNSVCGGLLQRFAFEAGLSPELRVIEESEAGVLIRQRLGHVLDARRLSELTAMAWRLGIEDWRACVHDLVNQARANDIAPDNLAAFGAQSADELLSHFPKATKADLDGKLDSAVKAARAQLQQTELRFDISRKYAEHLAEFQRYGGASRRAWSHWVKLGRDNPGKRMIEVSEPVSELANRYCEHPRLQDDIRSYLRETFDIAALVLGSYAAFKREVGALDFIDQEQLLLKCLDHPVIAATLKDELELLLVDEFQDTSPIQLALFVKLASYAKRTYWVGDVKQAIYGFRGSDTALMRAVIKGLPRLRGNKEILSSSWRSRPCLVDLVNQAFVPAFSSDLDAEEVRLTAERKEIPRQPAVGNWVLSGKNNAERMAALGVAVRALLDSGYQVCDKQSGELRAVRASDVAVLSRSNDRIREVAGALAAVGIATTTDGCGLMAQPESVLALACLRRMVDRGDTLASAEVVSLCDCAEPEEWLADRLAYLKANRASEAWREEGEDAHPVLRRLAEVRPRLQLLSPQEAVSLVIAQADLPRRVAVWGGGSAVVRQRLANLEALLAMAGEYQDLCRAARRPATASGLLLWLGEQQAAEADSAATVGVDAVSVLTNHGAKGLEWPVVVLIDLDAPARSRLWGVSCATAGKISIDAPLANRVIRYWPWPFGRLRAVDLAIQVAEGKVGQGFAKAAEDEDRRLLYVSMTRARDFLVLAGPGKAPAADTWLGRLEAPWLFPDGDDAKVITLPDRSRVAYSRSRYVAPEVAATKRPATFVHWFVEAQATARLPLYLNPSSCVPIACTSVVANLGSRIAIRPGSEMTSLGTAVHACIAASLADPTRLLSAEEIGGILAAMGCSGDLDAAEVHSQIQILSGWLQGEGRAQQVLVEVPIESVTPQGQILRGQIDLLARTTEGWHLVDHKANPGVSATWDALAAKYSGQLDAYSGAVERATGQDVISRHLFLAIAGGRVEVQFANRLEP